MGNEDCQLVTQAISDLESRIEARLKSAMQQSAKLPKCKVKKSNALDCLFIQSPREAAEATAKEQNASDVTHTLSSLWTKVGNPDLKSVIRGISLKENIDANWAAMEGFCPGLPSNN